MLLQPINMLFYTHAMQSIVFDWMPLGVPYFLQKVCGTTVW